MGYHDHKKLDVWKDSIVFVKEIYSLTKKFPTDEKFGLISQIRRAAVSIPANIAEGSGRNSDQQFINFLNISKGSASELDTLIEIAFQLGYINSEETRTQLQNEINKLEKQLYRFMKFLKEKNQRVARS